MDVLWIMCASREAPSVVLLAIHHPSMLFVVANVDICVRNATCYCKKHCTFFKHKRTYVLDDQLLTLGPCGFVDHAGAIIIISNINTITILFLALN